MTKNKFLILISILVILVVVLTGCAVAFPKSPEKLLASTQKVWGESASSVVDAYKISSVSFTLPVQLTGIGDHKLTLTINSGEIICERIVSADKIELNISFEKINITVDNQFKQILEQNYINIDKFAQVFGTVNILFTPTSLQTDISIENLNLINADLPPKYSDSQTYKNSDYSTIFENVKAFGVQTVFGTIMTNGSLDKNSSSYNYTLPKANVHDELLRLPKLLVDVLGDNKFENSDQTMQSILKNYFGTSNIVTIANASLTPKDLKIICNLEKTKKDYYIAKLSANYIGSGILKKDITEKIFDDVVSLFPTQDNNSLINMVTITGGMTISASLALSSRIILK